MAGERLPMRKIREFLRLHAADLSKRRIAGSLNIGATSASDYLRRDCRVGIRSFWESYVAASLYR